MPQIRTMLTLQQLRQDPAQVKARLAKKHFAHTELVDVIVALDDQRKKLQLDSDNIQAKINTLSKEIGMLMGKGQRDEADARKQEVAMLKASLQPLAEQLIDVETQLHNQLVLLPNLPSDQVPEGRLASDNMVVREGGIKPVLYEGAVAHWDLIRTYDLVDFEAGAK
ncbi:MAG: hypothetical protein ACKO41_05775, partial [Sphingomonadales bacterium]